MSKPEALSGDETSPPRTARLTVIQGPLKGTVFPLEKETVVIGSVPEVGIPLPGTGVGPRHAGLKWNGHTWEVFDLTGDRFHVNDIPTSHRVLGGGEIFRIGEHELHFTLMGASHEMVEPPSVLDLELERGNALGDTSQLRIQAGPGYTIGRTPDNDLAILDPLASRRHCRIEVIEGEAVLTDLGSLNGTHLEGRAVQQATLRAGDLIVVGKTALRCLRPV